MEFTKQETNVAKGAAICLMFLNHLYAFPDRLLHGNYYITSIPFFDIEFYIGGLGNICVSIFIFLSGYGMFLGYSRSDKSSLRYSLEKLKGFYLTYWSYFLVFIPIGLIFFKDVTLWNSHEARYSTEWFTVMENFLGWSARYNGEWWFVRMFVLLLVFFCPLYIYLAKQNLIPLFLISISIFLFSLVSRVDYSGATGFIFWQIVLATGITCARLKFFSSRLVQHLDRIEGFWIFLGISICFLLKFRFGAKVDFLLIPFFIYFVVRAAASLRLSKPVAYMGQYSFPMWLVHSFFCYYYFQDVVYLSKWSPLIFITLVIVSLLSAMSIEYLRSRLELVFKV